MNSPERHVMTQSLPPRAMRDDVMQLDPPQLLGIHCAACSAVTFPKREFCAACGAREGLSTRGLSRYGTVHCFTVVRQAPAGRAVPYVLACVDLPHDQVRVMAQLDTAPERVRIGLGGEDRIPHRPRRRRPARGRLCLRPRRRRKPLMPSTTSPAPAWSASENTMPPCPSKGWPSRPAARRSPTPNARPSHIEAVFVGHVFGGPVAGQRVATQLGPGRPSRVNHENYCASGATALREAWLAIAAGLYDVVLVIGVEKMTDRIKGGVRTGPQRPRRDAWLRDGRRSCDERAALHGRPRRDARADRQRSR